MTLGPSPRLTPNYTMQCRAELVAPRRPPAVRGSGGRQRFAAALPVAPQNSSDPSDTVCTTWTMHTAPKRLPAAAEPGWGSAGLS